MSTDILTRSFDNSRSGANTNETILTPAAVKMRGIKVLRTFHTDDPRLEAQPLYVSGLNVGGKVRNVIYQATMSNSVFAWDADSGEQLWKTNVGAPIIGNKVLDKNRNSKIDSHNININWGILSTPVIDRQAGLLYACAWISTDGSGNYLSGHHFVVALNLTTGVLQRNKLDLHGVTFDPGHGLKIQQFDSAERKQRSALALVNGAIVICFGSVSENDDKARGWVIVVDTVKWQVAAAWCSTAKGHGAGIWMSGAGPAIESDGSIWVVTGNGDFDGRTDFSESVVRLRYTPAAGGKPASLSPSGWWTPWTDRGRTGGNPEGEGATPAEKAFIKSLPEASNFRRAQRLAQAGIKLTPGDWSDQDLGASGIVLVEKIGVALVSGKDGILYTINLNHPGNTAPADLEKNTAAANYAKLAAPPILYTYFDPTMNPATTDCTTLNHWPGNATHHLHGTPSAWLSSTHGLMHFCGGENGNVRAWTLNANKTSTYLGCSAAFASPNVQELPNVNGPHGGMPGWSLFVSANGQNDGVVWAMMPYGDSNIDPNTPGRLLAYDAAQLGRFADGSGQLMPLWDSQDWGWNFVHPKFNRPVAADGRVLMPTYDGRLLVLGLA